MKHTTICRSTPAARMFNHTVLSVCAYALAVLGFLCLSASAAAQEADSLGTRRFRPGDHELLFMPTAFTMPAGNSYFEDYELLFLNFTTALTNTTHIGAFTFFPITTEFLESFTLGVKQNVYASERFGAAVFGSFTPKAPFGTIGGVVSFGSETTNGHIGYTGIIGESKYGDNGSETGIQGNIVMAGFAHRISSVTKILVEYENAIAKGNEFNGLLTVGLRFSGTSVAWDIAGIRPLASTGSLLFLPYIKVIVLL